jgi:hypothetical protein
MVKQIVETAAKRFAETIDNTGQSPEEVLRPVILAVLETHVKPMLAEAFCEGAAHGSVPPDECTCQDYATRLLASLTEGERA